MAQQSYKLDLGNVNFALSSRQQTRTIIGNVAGEAPSTEERPGVAYCHNVLPTDRGIKSVGFRRVIDPARLLEGEEPILSAAHIVYAENGARYYLSTDQFGRIHLSFEGLNWEATTTQYTLLMVEAETRDRNEIISTGTVQGVTYVCILGLGAIPAFIFTISELGSIVEQSPVGLDLLAIKGITSSSGYLLAYTEDAVAWSSLLDPMDFAPSSVTGSGGGKIAGLAGSITNVTQYPTGFLTHTNNNTISATYTGNSQFPFKFKEVAGSRGALKFSDIASESNSLEQFTLTGAGLQSVTSSTANSILPEVADFLSGRIYEYLDLETYALIQVELSTNLKRRLSFIANRFLVISFGEVELTDMFIYDIALKKLGRLNIPHTDVFELSTVRNEFSEAVISRLGIMQSNGAVYVPDTTLPRYVEEGSNDIPNNGVVKLGKLQYVRGRSIQLLKVDLESAIKLFDVSCRAMPSALEGSQQPVIIGYPAHLGDYYASYHFRSTDLYHHIAVQGKFELNTVEVTFSVAGKR